MKRCHEICKIPWKCNSFIQIKFFSNWFFNTTLSNADILQRNKEATSVIEMQYFHRQLTKPWFYTLAICKYEQNNVQLNKNSFWL